jgi:hypothetical protein
VSAVVGQLEDRLAQLQGSSRATKRVRGEIERIEDQLVILKQSLDNVDEVLDAMAKRREAARLSEASWQN